MRLLDEVSKAELQEFCDALCPGFVIIDKNHVTIIVLGVQKKTDADIVRFLRVESNGYISVEWTYVNAFPCQGDVVLHRPG